MKITKNTTQISNIGKFLDQPKLTKGINKVMPYALVGGSLALGTSDVYCAKKEDKKKTLIKNICTLGAVVGSSLIMVKGLKINGKKVIKGLLEHDHDHHHDYDHGHCHPKESLNDAIDKYLPSVKDAKIEKTLKNAKKRILSLKEITNLRNHTIKSEEGKKLFNKIVPPNEHASDSKHIFEEMGRLSLLGLVPVAGGIAGGTLGDKLTDKDWKKKVPDKIKEGAYQYLANIFLCNVGAGAALLTLETLNKKKVIKPPSNALKIGSMVGGVMAVGVIGGSAIANVIGQKIINPIFGEKSNGKSLYHERTPDPLDVSLHVDDMASIGVLSGFSWVEPALPLLYSVSGYRAGIGYRNNGHHHGHKKAKMRNNDVPNSKTKQMHHGQKTHFKNRLDKHNKVFSNFRSNES